LSLDRDFTIYNKQCTNKTDRWSLVSSSRTHWCVGVWITYEY
jgi:hypothetical protein